MELQFTPFSLLIGTGSLISFSIAYLIWQRRPGAGVNAFVAMMLGVGVWTFSGAIELAVGDLGWKIIAVNFVYLGVVIVNSAWLVFALEYTGRDKWVTKRNLYLLTIMPVLTWIAIWTNPLHDLFWLSRDVIVQDGLSVTDFEFGPLFRAHTAYQYSLVIVGGAILLLAVFRSRELYRGQFGLMLAGGLAPFVGNILFLSDLNPLPDYVDLTSITFTVSGIFVGWALYRFRLMDIVPVAREILVDNMVDGVLVVDSSIRIVDINDSALHILGLKDKTVVGKSLLEVWEKQRDLLLQFRDVEQITTEIELDVDGKERVFSVRISPLKNRRNQLIGRIATLNDITTLKQINRELLIARQKADEATRLKSEFLATMSHELRTPLGAVIGYSELMLTGMVGDLSEKHQEYTDRIFSNANYLLNLINDILDISKIEAGRMDLTLQPFEIKQWVNDIVTQHQVLADEKDLDFQVEIDERLPETLIGDAARLRQVVINLLSNAFKFTHEGHVKLKISQNDNTTWRIDVSDTGIGIPPHKKETIFEEFHQVDGSSTREYGGTGLGLAIARRFVLMMGGHIRLTSTLNEGSTFTIVLPVLSTVPEQLSMSSGD